jgi:hypothetical protein
MRKLQRMSPAERRRLEHMLQAAVGELERMLGPGAREQA